MLRASSSVITSGSKQLLTLHVWLQGESGCRENGGRMGENGSPRGRRENEKSVATALHL